jgi:hypothetical protein
MISHIFAQFVVCVEGRYFSTLSSSDHVTQVGLHIRECGEGGLMPHEEAMWCFLTDCDTVSVGHRGLLNLSLLGWSL